jgi:hypothetical protein
MRVLVWVAVMCVISLGTYALTGATNNVHISLSMFASLVILISFLYAKLTKRSLYLYAPFNDVKVMTSFVAFALSSSMVAATVKWSYLSIAFYLVSSITLFAILEFLRVIEAVSGSARTET